MRPTHVLLDLDVVQLDVQELVDALEGASDADLVLELDGDFVVDQGFEEAAGRGGLVVELGREQVRRGGVGLLSGDWVALRGFWEMERRGEFLAVCYVPKEQHVDG
jgi:hypothetical protein